MSRKPESEHDLERLLDADGGEFGVIYGRLSRPEPPRRLDRTVLANAARAVHGGRAPRAQRWALGIGSAAGIVLAAGIAWQVGKQMDSREAQKIPEGNGSAVIPVQPITESTRLQKAERDTPLEDKEVEAAATEATVRPAPAARRKAAAPPPAPAAAAPPPATPKPLLMEQQAVPAEPAPASTSADEAEAFPAKQDGARKDAMSAETGSIKRNESADRAAGNATTAGAPAADVRQSRAPSPNSSVRLRQNMHLAPQDWLSEIERLEREGRRQEAIENLRLFRRMHPDWKLSDELLRLAQ